MGTRNSAARVKAFCVGQAKSGTTSLCGMLSTKHRAAHEPEREALLEMILRESRHDVTPSRFRGFLLDRDVRLDLEHDISWSNQFVVSHLLAVFPAAKPTAFHRPRQGAPESCRRVRFHGEADRPDLPGRDDSCDLS